MEEGFISQLQEGLAVSGVNPGRGAVAEGSIMIARKQRDTLCISSLFFPPLLHLDPQVWDGAIHIQGRSSSLINPLWKYLH